MQDTAPPAPPAMIAPSREVRKPNLFTSAATPAARLIAKNPAHPTSPALSDAAVRGALIQQAGALEAAAKTAQATKAAAQTAATNAWWAAILALGGAVFTAFVAWRNGWLTARTTQQMKHADFRQKWIDSLREDMAHFTGVATEVVSEEAKEGKMRQLMSAIVLRMNKHDPEYHELIRQMVVIANASAEKSLSKKPEILSEFLLVSQRVLKREWEVTKIEMHATPWGRPFSWIANLVRRRRREEDREVVRRVRENVPLTPPKLLGHAFRWPLVWRRRQAPEVDQTVPVFTIGRLEIHHRKHKLAQPTAGTRE